jgi:probable F420-dependent oxidoreductase
MDFDSVWPECLSAMAFALGATTRLRVISSVLILPMRNPVIVAKAAQTLSIMSGGRLVLGVGVGWMAEEFEALGAPFAARGARTDEAIRIIRQLGSAGSIEWRGAHYQIPLISSFPVPDRPTPIYVGGDSDAALRRTAELGDGYLSTLRTRASLQKRIAGINARREIAGRACRPFEFIGVPADAKEPEDFAALEADGVNASAVMGWKASYETHDPPLSQKIDGLNAFAERVIKPLG